MARSIAQRRQAVARALKQTSREAGHDMGNFVVITSDGDLAHSVRSRCRRCGYTLTVGFSFVSDRPYVSNSGRVQCRTTREELPPPGTEYVSPTTAQIAQLVANDLGHGISVFFDNNTLVVKVPVGLVTDPSTGRLNSSPVSFSFPLYQPGKTLAQLWLDGLREGIFLGRLVSNTVARPQTDPIENQRVVDL